MSSDTGCVSCGAFIISYAGTDASAICVMGGRSVIWGGVSHAVGKTLASFRVVWLTFFRGRTNKLIFPTDSGFWKPTLLEFWSYLLLGIHPQFNS
ncbi:hypothetical protein CEXT_238281 [Caerostris extrusa]|uniref:Uncharacterized protein n=1 Tax=Caerostris extrusa TaxID=172846 RepID=A0AAV4MYS7_CAEEX|nr:hypothetical protein CEXT_238281 [Caerostris extrusa]